MRVCPEKKDCLVLDFAGLVSMHGPITSIKPPKKTGGGNGEAPVKVCENCHELCHVSATKCPVCGTPFPPPAIKAVILHNDDIMGLEGTTMEVTSWLWRKRVSRSSGNEMLLCTYYGELLATPVDEYLPIFNEGVGGQAARRKLASIAKQAGVDLTGISYDSQENVPEKMAVALNKGTPPSEIDFRRDGRFFRVLARRWAAQQEGQK